MSEFHAALKEHKKKEAEMKQELNECRVELLASRREMKALLVQTIDLPNDREKELENKFMVLTNELETARLSCQLFRAHKKIDTRLWRGWSKRSRESE